MSNPSSNLFDLHEFDPLTSASNASQDSIDDLLQFDDKLQNETPKPPPRKRPPPPPPPQQAVKDEASSEDVVLTESSVKDDSELLDPQHRPRSTPVAAARRHSSMLEQASRHDGDTVDGKIVSKNVVDTSIMNMSRPSKSSSFTVSSPSRTQQNATIGAPKSRSAFYTGNVPRAGNNEHGVEKRKNRDEYLHVFMDRREDEYTVKEKLNVFVGSWNVNGKSPSESLIEWLSKEKIHPDLYFIGFQELDLSKEAFVFTESSKENEWINKIQEALHPKPKYRLMKSVRLIGMMLVLFVSEEYYHQISSVSTRHVGTGLLGKMGNKGGVGIRLEMKNSSICVVNSHLAAHTENVKRRNQDYEDIKSRMKFTVDDSEHSLFDHDILVWLGDLNYRIEGLQGSVVRNWANDGKFESLKHYDQLLNEMSKKAVFNEFVEGAIKFLPTYKYDPGTDDWDTSEKARLPAWCDRILWWEKTKKTSTKRAKYVRQTNYKSHRSLRLSDHKPISSMFEFDVKAVDNKRYKKVLEEEMRRLDKMENDTLPSAKISNHMVDFGEVKFSREVHRSISITNTGQNPCHFEFITKPDINATCKPWLTIVHSSGLMMPNESMDIQFEIYINQTTAANLNNGKESLDDILVLHLHNGKDFFVTIAGRYVPSCFGSPLSVLCRMNRPIQNYSLEEIKKLNEEQESGQNLQAIPKELWKLIDHLYVISKEEEDLFQQPGLHEEVQNIREFLDTQPVTSNLPLPGSTHSVAEALLIFLASLPTPVIPHNYFMPCINSLQSDDLKASISEVIETLPRTHHHVLEYILVFLRELPLYPSNGLSTKLIAEIFSVQLLPVPVAFTSTSNSRQFKRKSIEFIEQCILLGG